MLSYLHAFHAGNFADVLKHIVISEILQYLAQKEKPFEYIDTHSGAGLFNLESESATKLNESSQGIGKLNAVDWPELASYFAVISQYNADGKLAFYPGSPLIAQHFMRPQDRGWLFELHPREYESLKENVRNKRQIKAAHADGFKGLLALLPPQSRRALVLIDPSYEVKADYATVFKVVADAYKKFSTGVYAIWYPVVDRGRIDLLERLFIESDIRNIQRYELAVTADAKAKGMTASGMIVINPPWQLKERMALLLPRLVEALAEDDGAFFRCDVLVDE